MDNDYNDSSPCHIMRPKKVLRKGWVYINSKNVVITIIFENSSAAKIGYLFDIHVNG